MFSSQPGSVRQWNEEETMSHMDQKAVALLKAAASGDHNLVSQLLASGVPVNGGGDGTRTPLHVAALAGHEGVVAALLEARVQIEAVSSDDGDKRALHLACRSGCGCVVELLLQAGADIEAREKYGWSPLHEASVVGNAQIVKILVEAGANIEATGLGRWQAIHRAAQWGRVEVIHALLDGGANIEAQGIDDCRPIHYAAMRGHIKVLEALVKRGCDLFARDVNGSTVLHSAAGGGQLQTIQWLVGKNIPHTILDGNKRTAEDMAQIYGYHHVKWWLYKQSPDAPSSQHNQAKISLEEYERLGEIGVRWAANGDDSHISSQIPNRPWRIHYQDAQGWSYLHHAAANNKV
ncbi:hypothetical protein Pcinc_003239 [Petrolisthes cinctipes]|uniref:Uncharacterized protein n=1 Tax=Petrolisthes cinctipes TaxID=88211 RepID=A0AAE1GGQ1_PETCI|nr:hypothetical protein Pcinc_003239 [Petrolisthes cinctipes]